MSEFVLSAVLELRDCLTGRVRNATRGLSSVRAMAGSASSSLDRTQAVMERAGASAGRLGRQLSGIRGNYQANVTARDTATPAVNRLRQGLSSINGQTASPTIRVRDEATSGISRIRQELSALTSRAHTAVVNIKQNAPAMMGNVKNSISNAANGMLMGAGTQMMGMAGVGYGIYDTVNTYKNFDKQMAAVKAISTSDMNEEEAAAAMDRLTKKAREMGAATQFSATEAAKAFEYMGMAGWNTEQMISGIPAVLNLALASGEDLASVSDIVTDAMTALKIDTRGADADKNIQHFTDVLAAAATHSNTNVGMMGEAFKYAAAPAGLMTSSYENAADISNDIALALGLMANSGIKASQAGTALRSTITRMTADTIPTANAMRMLGVNITQVGKDGQEQLKPLRAIFDDLRGKMKEGVSAESLVNYAEALTGTKTRNKEALIEFANKLAAQGGKLSSKDQAKFAKMFAGEEALSGWLAVMTATDEDYQSLIKALDNSEGTAAKMAATRADTLAGDFDVLKSAWEDLQIEFMTGKGSDGLREFLKGIQKDVNKFKEYIKDGFDISDVGKIALDVITQLKNKFLEMDGIGSILAGGALAAGLYKLSSLASNVAEKVKDLVQTRRAGGRGGGGSNASPSSIGDLASNVNSMVVNAKSVVVNGSIAGGGGNGGGAELPDIPDVSGNESPGNRERRSPRPARGRGRRVSGGRTAPTSAAAEAAASSGGKLASLGKWAGRLGVPLAVAAGAWEAYNVSQDNDAASQAAQERVDAANTNLDKLRVQAVGLDAAAAGFSNEELASSLASAGVSAKEISAAMKEQQEALAEQKTVENENTNRMGAAVAGTGGALVGGIAGAKAGAMAGGAIGTLVGGPVGTAAGAAIGGAVGGIGGAIAGSELGASIGGQATEIKEAFSSAWESIKAEASNTGEWLSNQFNGIKDYAGQAWQGVKDSAQNEWDYVKNTAGEMAQGIQDKLGSVKDWATTNFGIPIYNAFVDALNFTVGAAALLGGAIGEALAPVVSWIDQNVWTPIKDYAGQAWDSITATVSEKWETIKTAFSETAAWFDMSVWQPLKETAALAWQDISSLPSMAAELAGSAWGAVSEWFDMSVWQPLSQMAATAWGTATATATAAWDAVSAYFAPAAAWFDSSVWQPISSTVSGVQSAITGAFESAWSAVTGLWSTAASWFESNVIAPVKAAFAKVASIGAGITGLTKIGGNAIGTSSWSGGWTEINEHGGEIVDLPTGSRIYPHATTMKMLQDMTSSVQDMTGPAATGMNISVSDIIGSTYRKFMEFAGGAFQPESRSPIQIFGESGEGESSGGSSSKEAAPKTPLSITISGNTFTVREDADINRIAYELFRLINQASGNYQFTGG